EHAGAADVRGLNDHRSPFSAVSLTIITHGAVSTYKVSTCPRTRSRLVRIGSAYIISMWIRRWAPGPRGAVIVGRAAFVRRHRARIASFAALALTAGAVVFYA